VGDDSLSGSATRYEVRYSTSPITSANFSSATLASGAPAPRPAGSAESMTVSGLSPSTTYFFALRVRDDAANYSALSNVVSMATGVAADTTPPAAIRDLTPN
jgi:chitodextrinase